MDLKKKKKKRNVSLRDVGLFLLKEEETGDEQTKTGEVHANLTIP